MKNIYSIIKVLLGSLIIGFTLNVFFVDLNYVSSGIFGFSQLYAFKTGYSFPIVMLLTNTFFLIMASLVFSKKHLKKAIITFWIIPFFVYFTKDIPAILNIANADKFVLAIYGGILMGVGYRFIYRENMIVSATDTINSLEDMVFYDKDHMIVKILDVMWLIFASKFFGIENALYSLISIVIMEVISKRVNIGVSESKVFYIITTKEKEIKRFIIEELKYDLTVIEVKGGFTGNKSKVIMSVIPTYDYFRLKEGVKYIDPNAFISITDSYETINGRKKKKK